MKQRSKTPWKKSRTYGDIYGGRVRRRMADNIFARSHSLKAPAADEHLPIFVEDNPSREYYFPISKADIEAVLEKLSNQGVEGLTHIWLRREANSDGRTRGAFGEFACGSKVRVIILYPWPVDGRRYWGRKKPSLRWQREFERFSAELKNEKGRWYVFLEGEKLKRLYLESVFLHEIGHHIDWYKRSWSKANNKQYEEFADQYAILTAKDFMGEDNATI